MGRFTGRAINPRALGGKNFFGLPPLTPSGFIIQAGAGGFAGFSLTGLGWDGMNGNVGPGTMGVLISGTASAFPAGAQFAIGDATGGAGPGPLILPYFVVSSGNIWSQNQFASITIHGHTYLTAAADFFDNGGGCGPTIWEWQIPAGLVAGVQYPVIFT